MPVAVDSVTELFFPVVSLPLPTSVTLLRSTMPRGFVAATTFWSAKRNRKPCLSTNQRRRQVRRCSPWDWSHPDFSALCQYSTSSCVGSCRTVSTVSVQCKQALSCLTSFIVQTGRRVAAIEDDSKNEEVVCKHLDAGD